MNNKRQTIWLVSMLSLMVILSAYYLFTEDAPAQNASDSARQTDQSGGAAKTGGNENQGAQVTEVDPSADGTAIPDAGGNTDQTAAGGNNSNNNANDNANDSAKDGQTSGTSGQTADGGTVSPGDETVLKEMTNLKGVQFIDNLQRQQDEKFAQKTEDLSAVLADTKNHTQEQASSAVEELTRLDDTESRMTSLEEKLVQDYDNAVVTEDQLHFKVVVQAAKLEKKQAVHIIDLAAKELNVTPDRLSVQYVP